ncbi:MAG TPA: DNA recombination protein RmuC [Candidatus Enterousia intestinigallinarum]|uniref:DNA recombination protein RmuC homolog n=1 Tax=Candidatus Enterousia intestinigallinarum TaxID=2840790 RepID=A0A9D1FFF4_9PROT|nr:DNA recombination protein RmuC [Candidatus Enterousia intestinigallinarum]
MTTYIFVLLFIIIVLLIVLLMRRPTVDISGLREDNARLRERLAERLGALSQNAIELKNISADIANFKNILMGNKQARGTFGERQLEDLVADIMPPESYAFQCVMDTGVRPDCIIRLPYPPGDMIIDSKFPLESYNRMTAQNDDGARKQFELDVRKHIDAIAEKYIIPGKTAESAMMFIASESIFETLHREFPGAVDYAARRKVFIVSPSTLWATLNTIRAVLSDIKIKRVADKIKRELDLLLADLSRLADRAGKVQQHFAQASTDIEQLQTSIGKIAPRAEKLREMNFGEEE